MRPCSVSSVAAQPLPRFQGFDIIGDHALEKADTILSGHTHLRAKRDVDEASLFPNGAIFFGKVSKALW